MVVLVEVVVVDPIRYCQILFFFTSVALQRLREIIAHPAARVGKNTFATDNAVSAMLHIANSDKHGI